jgi:hypothetical protein
VPPHARAGPFLTRAPLRSLSLVFGRLVAYAAEADDGTMPMMTVLALSHGDAQYPKATLAVAILFLAVGVAMLCSELRALIYGLASRSWPSAEAEVIQAAVERHGRLSIHFEPSVTFRYRWNGRELLGKRLTFGGAWTSDEGEAQRWVERYPVGSHAVARVCPSRPKLVTLVPGPERSLWWRLVFSIVWIAFSSFFVWGALRPFL